MGARVAGGESVLAGLRARVAPLTSAGERLLPVRPDLAALLPWGGLQRGTVTEVDRPSVLLTVLGAATQAGSWAAFVGTPGIGFAAAPALGVDLERVAVVSTPAPDQMATVIGALLDAVELVVIGPRLVHRATDARRLVARARERGSALFSLGGWPEAVDLRITRTSQHVTGVGRGHGHVQGWTVSLESGGRGAASRPRRTTVVLAEPADWTLARPVDSPAVDPVSGVDPVNPVSGVGPANPVSGVVPVSVSVPHHLEERVVLEQVG